MKAWTLLFIGIAAFPCFGQTDIYSDLTRIFPEQPAVFVERSETLNIQLSGDSLEAYSDVVEDILHLREQTDIFSGKRVYGSHFTQIADLKAKTLVWEKNRYREVQVSGFKKNADTDKSIFYDDSYYYTFDFPLIASRNRTQLQYRELHRDPRFIAGYMFASYLPQAKTSFTIRTTRDVDIFYKVLNDPDKKIKFNRTEKGRNVILEWSAENLDAVRSESESPSIRYYAPHVVCYVRSFQGKNGPVKVLSGVDDLYKWYQSFIKGLNQETSPELKAIVNDLRAASHTEEEFVKNVFYWVQQHIQYIAFEQGMRGFIPHHASYTCEKRYGDCKDMANLIVGMLQAGGVRAYHTWIGSRNIPYKYSELPTPLVDDHMIATYIAADGRYYFLDATSDYTKFGYPSSMIQGKEALIATGPGTYEVKEVPVMDMDANVMADSMTLRIEDGQLVGTGVASLTGYAKVFGGYQLDRSEQEDIRKYVTKLVGKGNNKFFLDRFEVGNVEKHDLPTRIVYDFRVSDYFQRIGEDIFINLNLNKDFYNAVINPKLRSTPKENDYKYVKVETIQLDIPEGYTVDYLPENVTHKGNLLGYDISYRLEGSKVFFTKRLYLNYLLLLPSGFQEWNESVRSISNTYKESIILKKKS